jgi:serine phosphatase RsbU (regulator of sigma subunit)
VQGKSREALNFRFRSAECYEKDGIETDSMSLCPVISLKSCKTLGLDKAVRVLDSVESDNIYIACYTLASDYIEIAKKTGESRYADSCRYYYQKAEDYFMSKAGVDDYRMFRYVYTEYLSFCGKYREAVNVMRDLEKTFDDKTPVVDLVLYHARLSNIYLSLGDYKNAYIHVNKYYEYYCLNLNDNTEAALSDAKAQQAVMLEKLERKNTENIHKEEKLRMRSLIITLFIGLILIYRVFWLKKKANEELFEKNFILNSQKAEIEAQKDEIETQKEIITQQWHDVEKSNQRLLGSIYYAKRIQTAAVSKVEDVKALFPDSFVFYRPRDIVSGDFYRCVKCGKYSVMIIADCTGHGIPGAFLSMLGLSGLKEFCVTEDDAVCPGTILDRMREFIKSTLVSETGQSIDDGMDMTVCCFDFAVMELRYAAANQTAYLIRRGEIIKLKGDRMPVGRYIVEKEHFKTQIQPLEKGDMVYMCSDGIQDQPGGCNDGIFGRKFLERNLVAFLSENYSKPMDVQCALLDKKITGWRGSRPQVDDMTMIGIRV